LLNNKYVWTVLSIGLAILVILYTKTNTVPRNAIFAFFVVLLITFAFPVVGMIMIIPIAFIVYRDNYKNLSSFYDRVKNIQFVNA
jgi:cell division protein FtsW (lipid II flippase)